jgi:SAM-dependent methyltransferase
MTPGERLRARATSFGAVAAEYERGRPGYPAEAVGWLLPPGARRVADLGAGTGKLTRQLLGRGLAVVAVEPSAGMRAQLRQAVPAAPVVAGTAERLPLAGRSVDAVLAGQAWHWVNPSAAVPEVARVLAPGGWLGLLWNYRDERVDWVARLSEIMHESEAGYPDRRVPEVGPPFGPLERLTVRWDFRLPAAALADYVTSRSYIATMPARQRAQVLAGVAALLATHPALAGAAEISMPQVTCCFRAAVLAPPHGRRP